MPAPLLRFNSRGESLLLRFLRIPEANIFAIEVLDESLSRKGIHELNRNRFNGVAEGHLCSRVPQPVREAVGIGWAISITPVEEAAQA